MFSFLLIESMDELPSLFNQILFDNSIISMMEAKASFFLLPRPSLFCWFLYKMFMSFHHTVLKYICSLSRGLIDRKDLIAKIKKSVRTFTSEEMEL